MFENLTSTQLKYLTELLDLQLSGQFQSEMLYSPVMAEANGIIANPSGHGEQKEVALGITKNDIYTFVEEGYVVIREIQHGAFVSLKQKAFREYESQRNPKSLATAMIENKSIGRVFIGHGHSLVWLQLREFLERRLKLNTDEFNRESVAGTPTQARLEQMLADATFAFLVMTAEDLRDDGSAHARENVVHETGLFQGRLGFQRAIVLLEEGCEKFSNIHGLTHIGFPKGNIAAAFEDVRRVLEREKVVHVEGEAVSA